MKKRRYARHEQSIENNHTVVIIGVAAKASYTEGTDTTGRKAQIGAVPAEQTDGDQAKDNGDRKDNGETALMNPAMPLTGPAVRPATEGTVLIDDDKELLMMKTASSSPNMPKRS